jgi:putative ABC transport system permease protein
LKRNKTSFFINLIGLSTGLACALLIYLWINDEIHIDKFLEKDGQRYVVMENDKSDKGIQTFNLSSALLAEALAAEMPEVEYAAPSGSAYNHLEGILSDGDNHLKASGFYTSKDFFNVFSCKLIQGDKNNVLADKNSIAISEPLAKKLFKTTENIIGKTLEWNSDGVKGKFIVSGVFTPAPPKSTEQFDVLFHIDSNQPWMNDWGNYYVETCILLKEGTDIGNFNKKIAGFLKSKVYYPTEGSLFVQKYSDRYLYGNYENGIQSGGRITYVRLFSVIAIFILLIACINFMNLSTAQVSTRLKEVGIKKAIGSSRKALVVQYLSESMMITFLSLIIASLLVLLLLPQFNIITGKHLDFEFSINIVLSILSITLFTGLMSGSYPAFYLSGFNPVAILKGKFNTSLGELWVRKGLVIFQFALSVIFIVGLLVVNKQIEYTQTKNMGYNRDNIICFQWKGKSNVYDKINSDFDTFMAELKNIPGVVNSSDMSGSILKDIYKQAGVSWSGRAEDKYYIFESPIFGYNCIETLGLKIIAGRSFSREYNDDNSKVILNEAAVKMMDLKDPVGNRFKRDMDIRHDMTVIGVVKDFHYGSLHNNIEPMIIRFLPYNGNILVKMKAGTEVATIGRIKGFYQKFFPEYPFDFTFMDAEYQKLYESESKVAALSKYFAGLAIIISCLGLFGLAAFTAERRRKEIGVRKVFGSTELSIFYLLSGDFTKQVLVSIFIALPVSYLAARNWLNTFASRTDLEWWFFAGAGFMALFIAWLTVGSQAVRAANTNPAECLKDE